MRGAAPLLDLLKTLDTQPYLTYTSCCAEGFGLSIIVFLHGGVYDIYGLDYNSGLTNYMSTPISIGHIDNLVKAYQYWKGEDETKAAQIADMLISKYGKESQVIKKLNL